ncbi:hypothetical protein [Roseofilum casamattae]|uniref:CopG family transcriptional regulator n=1 Tax=Roseofilum casamattae BLCC-M143 TaxID=3022442 RepID=A0ABT7C1Q9_9CYAN|nr:hypothetical protein [Roseofilum casamattae]MDJ1185387.1 hypothetical protein [Roseofilum casamattae BLCC-M143]
MVQVTVKVEETHALFLHSYQDYGFSNRDALVSAAIERLRQELESTSVDLEESARLYAEIYQTCRETQELTEIALSHWPE